MLNEKALTFSWILFSILFLKYSILSYFSHNALKVLYQKFFPQSVFAFLHLSSAFLILLICKSGEIILFMSRCLWFPRSEENNQSSENPPVQTGHIWGMIIYSKHKLLRFLLITIQMLHKKYLILKQSPFPTVFRDSLGVSSSSRSFLFEVIIMHSGKCFWYPLLTW